MCTHIHVLNLWCFMCNEHTHPHAQSDPLPSQNTHMHSPWPHTIIPNNRWVVSCPISSPPSPPTFMLFQSHSIFRYSEVSSSPWLRVHAQAQAYLCPPVPPIPHRTQGQRLSDPAVDAFIVHAPVFTRLAGSRRRPTFLRSSTHSVCAEFSFQNVARLR
jgi:hypothetical protein